MADSNRSSTSTYVTAAAVSLAVGLAAYAVYFDYKRRNDVEFRKKLKKEKKRVQKTVASNEKSETAPAFTAAELREVLKQLKAEQAPTSPEEKEGFFMNQVGLGEQLAMQGPTFYLPAAMAFYRALRVYPSPVELIVIYQKTIPEPVFKIVMDLTNLDVENRIQGYYDTFPPKKANVSVVTRDGQTMKQALVVTKDIQAGEVIYKEHPVVTALDSDLQILGTHCAHCLRPIDRENDLFTTDSSTAFAQTYCSTSCQQIHKAQSHLLLFSLDNPLPGSLAAQAAETPASVSQARKEAQEKFAEWLKKEGKAIPLLVARFIARQVAIETQKLANASSLGSVALGGPAPSSTTQPQPPANDFTDADGAPDTYTLSDHLERLRFLELERNEDEEKLLIDVLRLALPGLEDFMTAQKHAIVSGKMAYNAFGVVYGTGRDDRPLLGASDRPEDVERTRTPWGTTKQIGSAFYTLSSYLTHSCTPSARPAFLNETSELFVIANRDLKAGDEVTIAYVDVDEREGEGKAECRRRRRYELARGWRFACQCERCKEEAEGLTLEEKGGAGAEEVKDESKVEDVAKKAAKIGEQAALDRAEDIE